MKIIFVGFLALVTACAPLHKESRPNPGRTAQKIDYEKALLNAIQEK